MTHQGSNREYIEEVRQWFLEIDKLFKNQLNENNSPRLLEKINEFSILLESLDDNMDLELLSRLKSNMESLYNEGLLMMSEQSIDRQTDYRRVKIGEHTLPPLPYNYDALEPYISEEIMKLHHDKHHKSYVEGLNKAEKMMQKARETGDFELIKHWEREAAFHGSGHYLHTIFWNVMSPEGGGMPSRYLLTQINKDFGSFDRFKKHFSEAANKVEGVGWAILVWAPRSGRLEILQAERHQFMTQWDTIPLLVLDVWEHAYYLQYKNRREEYVNNWWNIVNWKEVEHRFQQASKLNWKEY
ncbi:superoxide dismutase [Ferdinandcohnia quinoae]|uniref:superoxide dismutase n=1 Tax=Fredinandcohnia quinoae TaxID=2918902 RepID=A0AAW5E488_9BACI|nr:superoxide dismutase [Fredinandcohnia sp. SECRCQ15]MCH1624801.1 superoxide dismutase [Fredinandcohnia sp. SECRCQ15]